MFGSHWLRTAHGRVLLLSAVWLAALLLLVIALKLPTGEQADWRLLGYLALWAYASPVVGLAGLAVALSVKVKEGSDLAARAKTRIAAIATSAMILLISAAILWNASRG